MSQEENLRDIKKLWAALAAYFQLTLSDAQIQMYAADCAHYSAEAIGRAMKSWRMNPKHGRMPLPGQLLESMGGGSSRSCASAIAISLIGAIKRHDYTWPALTQPKFYETGSFEGDFRKELGDVAWDVVKLAGGWPMFCGSFWDCGNDTAFIAQIRDAIEHVIGRNRGQVHAIGENKSAAALPAPEDHEARKHLEGLAGKIGGPKEGA